METALRDQTGKRKVKGVPQSQTAANPRQQEAEKKGKTRTKTNTRKTDLPLLLSNPCLIVDILK